jgi:DNA-binding MarR family transcriptional regulator
MLAFVQATSASTQSIAKDLAAFMALVHRTSQGEWLRTVDELDLSLTQLKTLHLTAGSQAELSIKDLACALSLSLPAASRAADGLVHRGLVARRECAEDRRSRLISLTDDGRATLERVFEARLAGLEDFVAGLGDTDRAALGDALKVLVGR